MFERLRQAEQDAARVTLTVDGTPISVLRGDTAAAALLLFGHLAVRTMPTSGKQRGPYCMMGVCFDCLVTIDGRPNRQACMTPVVEGMDIRTDINGKPNAG